MFKRSLLLNEGIHCLQHTKLCWSNKANYSDVCFIRSAIDFSNSSTRRETSSIRLMILLDMVSN